MKIIYLSPHLDDVAYSFGGSIWEQVKRGSKIEIWTLFSGSPGGKELSQFASSLHDRWRAGNDPTALRSSEDISVCRLLGCGYRHLDYMDCIYRRLPDGEPLIQTDEDLFSLIIPEEQPLVRRIAESLADLIPAGAILISPLGVGGHVDHRITRASAELLGERLSYYADFPYASRNPGKINGVLPPNAQEEDHQVSPEGLGYWHTAVATFASQFSSFWQSEDEMKNEITLFASSRAGCRLWFQASV